MIEVGKSYKLRASKIEITIVSMSKSGKHATVRFHSDRTEHKLSTSDIETAIYNDNQATGALVTDVAGNPYPGFPQP